MELDLFEVSNIFASHYASVVGYDDREVSLDLQSELQVPHRSFNTQISSIEFRHALFVCTEGALGHDRITYSMIRHSH